MQQKLPDKTNLFLNYFRLLVLCIFAFILIEQQVDFFSRIVPSFKSIVPGKDFISQQEQSLNSIKKVLPVKGIYCYEADNRANSNEFEMFYLITRYSLAPRVITDSAYTDTMVCNFSKTLSLNNPQNPLYATHSQWSVIADNGAGIMLIKKNK